MRGARRSGAYEPAPYALQNAASSPVNIGSMATTAGRTASQSARGLPELCAVMTRSNPGSYGAAEPAGEKSRIVLFMLRESTLLQDLQGN